MTLAQRLITFFINLSWLNAVKIFNGQPPKIALPFSGVIMKHELSSMKAFVYWQSPVHLTMPLNYSILRNLINAKNKKDGGRFTYSTI